MRNWSGYILLTGILMFFSGCISMTEQNKYDDYSYERLVKKLREPEYDGIYTVDKNSGLSFIDPNYAVYFTDEELENGARVRKMLWNRAFNKRIIVWMKDVDGQWIAFDSLEYNRKYTVF